jgi:adenine-specific DNA-methyltransferase
MSRACQMTLMDVAKQMPSRTPDPGGEHGEVFTRRWVVDLILDLAGYRAEEDLGASVIVEPSCGCGAFILPIVERLAEACEQHGRDLADMADAIHGFDLLEHNAELTRKAVTVKLLELGETVETAERLSAGWVTTGDFLLADHGDRQANFVVGNPPYIRLEDVPTEVSDAYRRECATMRGRADIFVGFFEKGLSMLAPEGRLAFICADRWMRNQYGERLRSLVAESYAVDSVVVMHEVDAFEDDVSAYPAVTVLRRGEQGAARVVEAHASFDAEAGRSVAQWAVGGHRKTPTGSSFEAAELPSWFEGGAHWPSGSPQALELIADLEERFGPLEDPQTGTRVGIGVASGCDDVYVVADAPGVEESRLLPLLRAKDITGGTAEWSGRYLVNPWEQGRLVDLTEYPGLAAYLDASGDRVRARHVARKRPASWYRTIDRVDPALRARPKLLLPDIKSASHPVLDRGEYYPHHNLYFVVSDTWDLEVLGGLLLSDVANLFVGAYCVKMRGGTYRFQAQYLRKIRVPSPTAIEEAVADGLREAFRNRDAERASEIAWSLYGVDAATTLQPSVAV